MKKIGLFFKKLFGFLFLIESIFIFSATVSLESEYILLGGIIALSSAFFSYLLLKEPKASSKKTVVPNATAKKTTIKTSSAKPQNTAIPSDNNIFPNEELLHISSFTQIAKKQTSLIPDEVLHLLWIKDINYIDDNNLTNEPSLIDMNLEIREDMYLVRHPLDIGYYPSYANLSPEQRFVYLNWLRDVTIPIPIGYVFIFYYGLERHLLFGNFEEAFHMIVKLRNYHNNNSFYSYSSDALLISILHHKRYDLISQIDLNKANSKLVQFVLAALTGGIDSTTLIENCHEVEFTNKRYIKDSYELFKNTLEDTLKEKYGVTCYPVKESDLLKCKNTFPLTLANYSLSLTDRIAKAPDLATNQEYVNNIYEILNETHEKVKKKKREARKTQTVSRNKKEILLCPEEKISELMQLYSDVENEYNFIVSSTKYSVTPHDAVPFNENEEIFFKALVKAMKDNKLWNKENLQLTRLSNRTFNVDCNTCHIGKIRLQKDGTLMQVFRGSSQIKVYEDRDLKFYLEQIPAWVRYIKYCKRV